MAQSGRVIWITGLSGSGKTTLANALIRSIPGAILLDGDDLRVALGVLGEGFDSDSRRKLASTYARLGLLLARQGFDVVMATISMFHEIRHWNRVNLPGYVEVFLDVPSEVLRSRDSKGLYRAITDGIVSDMAGADLAVELPIHPDLRFDHQWPIAQCVAAVLKCLEAKG